MDGLLALLFLFIIALLVWMAVLIYFAQKMLKDLMALVVIALALVTALAAYVFFIEPNEIAVNRLHIEGTGADMKIVFMSDFQRNDADPAFIQRAVDLANSENPDLVLLGGDYVELSDSELPSVAPLRTLHATYGVYGVMGNHDYGLMWAGRCPSSENLLLNGEIKNFLEAEGTVTILGNENRRVGNATLIALDDLWGCRRNESKALEGSGGATGAGSYRILLSHNQDGLVIGNSTADLYLFGHTHCGQVRLPFLGSVPKMFGFRGEYDDGHYLVDGSDVYTTCGLSFGPRFLAPPEITVIELD